MAEQQRQLIISAVILAIILAGVLMFLMTRKPEGTKITAISPSPEMSQVAEPADGDPNSTPAADLGQLFSISTQTEGTVPAPEAVSQPAGEGRVAAAVSATAPTGPADWFMGMALAAAALGSLGLTGIGASQRNWKSE